MLHVPAQSLVAVSIKSVLPTHFAGNIGHCTPYILQAESFVKNAEFTFKTAPLPPYEALPFHLLHQHGFTVVELPPNWLIRFDDPVHIQGSIIRDALRHLGEVIQLKEKQVASPTYKELSRTVLLALEEVFPQQMSNLELKHLLKPEPSDAELFDVLDGLQHQGFIDGKGLRGSQSGQSKLVVMNAIRITARGQDEISDKPPASSGINQTFINHGQVAAMGPNSVGTINYQHQWAASADDFNLAQVAMELQTLKTELMKSATTPSDFQQLSQIAEAEQYAVKQDGPKVLEALSKSGKWLFDFATHVGTDITAKMLAKAMGLEP